MEFCFARLNVYMNEQKRLFKNREFSDKIEILNFLGKLIIENPDYYSYYKPNQTGFQFDNFVKDENNNLIAAYIGKPTKSKFPKHDENIGYYKEKIITNPFVLFLYDTKNQMISIQYKSKPFENYNNLFNAIKTHLNEILLEHGYRIEINPITEKKDFWTVINESDNIFSVSLHYDMPNIYAETDNELKNILGLIKDSTNTTSLTEIYENKEGNLNISEADKYFSVSLDYIAHGEGNWKIKFESNGKKSEIKSNENIEFTKKQMPSLRETENLEDFSLSKINSAINYAENYIPNYKAPEKTKKLSDR